MNDEVVYLNEFVERIKKELSLPEEKIREEKENIELLKETLLNAMIDEKLMLLRARALSLSISDEELSGRIQEIKSQYPDGHFAKIIASQNIDFEIWKEDLRNRMLLEKVILTDVFTKITVSENEAKAHYRKNRKRYENGNKYHVSQIIVREEKKAKILLHRLKRGEDFAKVAREESMGPEAARGGDLGWVYPSTLPEEIESALYLLTPGETSHIIKSPYGYHIILLLEIEKARKRKWDEIKDAVINDVKRKKEEEAFHQWLEELRSGVTVHIDKALLRRIDLQWPQKE